MNLLRGVLLQIHVFVVSYNFEILQLQPPGARISPLNYFIKLGDHLL